MVRDTALDLEAERPELARRPSRSVGVLADGESPGSTSSRDSRRAARRDAVGGGRVAPWRPPGRARTAAAAAQPVGEAARWGTPRAGPGRGRSPRRRARPDDLDAARRQLALRGQDVRRVGVASEGQDRVVLHAAATCRGPPRGCARPPARAGAARHRGTRRAPASRPRGPCEQYGGGVSREPCSAASVGPRVAWHARRHARVGRRDLRPHRRPAGAGGRAARIPSARGASVENVHQSLRFGATAMAVVAYAVAMAYLEAAVVLYLQLALGASVGVIFPLQPAAQHGGRTSWRSRRAERSRRW